MIRCVLLIALLFIFHGCDSRETVGTATQSPSVLLQEDFENKAVGDLDMTFPWERHVGTVAYMSSYVTDQGCIQGDHCLKTKSIHTSNDPYYAAYYALKVKNEDLSKPAYMQFYFKYSSADSYLNITPGLPGGFQLNIDNVTGIVIPQSGNSDVVVDPGNITENVWYRVEMSVKNRENPLLNIRIYQGNETIPINGSTLINDIPIDAVESLQDNVDVTLMYMESTYVSNNFNLIQDPETDLEPFAWYLDDIRIGYDENETLLVGF